MIEVKGSWLHREEGEWIERTVIAVCHDAEVIYVGENGEILKDVGTNFRHPLAL